MKKILSMLVVGLVALSSSVFADSYWKLDAEALQAQNQKIMGIQPISELVGENMSIVKLGYGFSTNGEPLAARAGVYASAGEANEYGVGIDFQVDIKSAAFYGITPYFGGDVGVGMRNDSGSTKKLSTSVDKVSYITAPDLSALIVPTTATMIDDTTFVKYGFKIGLNYNFTPSLLGYVAYTYSTKTYNVSYRTAATPNILNDITLDQRNNGVTLGVSYKF